MREKRSFTRNKWVVVSWTALSRVFGLVRDILTAAVFGTSSASDAFMVAFALPNLFRNLFGEGAAGIAFVPIFDETCRDEGRPGGFRLASAAVTLLGAVLGAISILGVLVFSGIAVFGKGSTVWPLSAVMFPYLFFICLAGFLGKLLNCLDRYGSPAALPVIFNISWILGLLVFSPLLGGSPERRVFGLAAGVLLGGVAQLWLQCSFLGRAGFHFRADFDFSHPGLGRIFARMAPTLLAMAALQINTLADKYLAKVFLPEGSVSSLFYANHLVQFPLGVFGVSLATAALPLLSRMWAQKRERDFQVTLFHALGTGLLIALPAALGLIILRYPLVRLLFQWRHFDAASTLSTAPVVLWYATGLVFFIVVKIVTQAFYALGEPSVPARAGLAAVGINLGLNLLVVLHPFLRARLGAGGLALSTSVSYLANSVILLLILKRRLGLGEGIGRLIYQIPVAAAFFAAVCYFLQIWIFPQPALSLPLRLLQVLLPGGAALFAYLLVLRLLGVDLKQYLPSRRD